MPKLYQPEQLSLSNGIPVILQHYDGPVATIYWWNQTGSADEAPAEAGFAHFLEHMLFKDAAAKETGKASTGKLATTVESLGGDINAYTSFDQTVYHVTCAAHHWERVIAAFGTMAKPQKFLKSDFDREREVILEELRKNEDSPGRQLFQGLFSSTFKKHPYGRPVIGFVKMLKAARVSALEAFYRRNYVSGKMGLILVGPFMNGDGTPDPRRKKLLALLEKYFGVRAIPRRAVLPVKRVVEQQLRDEPDFQLKPFDVKTPTVSLSFRVPDILHEDVPALDLLAGILGMGELSRMYQELFYKRSLVTDVSGGLYVPRDPGMIYFQAEVDSMDKIQTAAEAMLQELKRIAEQGVTADELARVLVNSESERLYATQTADGIAGRLGYLKFVLGDLGFDQEYLEDLRAVDSTKIKEVAAKYFDYQRMGASVLVPKAEAKYDLKPLKELAKRILGSAAAPAAVAKKKGILPVEVFKLSSGTQVVYHHRPHSQVFSVHASALGGLRLELSRPIESAEKDWGVSTMLAMSWAKGTQQKDARKISAIVEGSAAGLDGFSGRNSIGLQATGLGRDWAKLSDLFTEVLLTPSFPDEEVNHVRRIAEDTIRSLEDHTSQLCMKLFLETLFENHPYGKLTHGSLESIQTIKQAKLKLFHQAWVRPDRLVLSVSGPIGRGALDHWLDSVEKQARLMPTPSKQIDLSQPVPLEPTLKAPRWVERKLGREQAHIVVGGLGSRIGGEDRFALRILQNLLGGQSGRLFIELREKKSLAYSVSPISFEGLEPGYIGTYIACSPQKREEAIQGIRTVLENLVNKGCSDKELSRAKEFYLGRRAMDLQSDSSIAAHYGLETLYQMPPYSEAEIVKQVERISAKHVRDVCRKYLVEPHMVTAVVG